MIYQLENATVNDSNLLIKYKLNNILEYAKDLDQEEITKINNYVNSKIPKQINNYKIIKVDNKIIGCLLVEEHLDGVILDEIFIEEKYRNNGIGTKIINIILSNYSIVYLWVYKDNVKAVKLYEKLGFLIIENTETRYFMKYSKKM
jgi:ribosomal protein S18 acetylase RimI-like enzyme